ncbi:carboxymuconolactone decarboxylase family protein, partial [Acinetobacter baumannii]|nr:carboxymuconolactone decarboxylase family protein [Acinetobacter baumannii]
AGGVPDAKHDSLAGWSVADHFSPRERAALAWTEALTLVDRTGAPDADYEPLKEHFSDVEISDLTFAIALMSAFNRLAVGMRQ